MRSRLGSTLGVFAAVAAITVAAPAGASVGGVVAINELMPSPIADDGEFLELRNVTPASVDVSGWCFTSGISGCLPPGTVIPADGFLLMVQDEAIARAEWGIPASTPVYLYSGGQSSGGETITLVDDSAAVADQVTYQTSPPWPTEPLTGLASYERIDPTVASSSALNWAASDPAPTPGAENTAYDPGTVPDFDVVDMYATPFRPAPGEAIVVTAEVSDPALTVDLTYVVNFDPPVVVPMTNLAGNTWEATIPGQGAGDLVRFRADADTGALQAGRPAVGDSINYEGVVVLNPSVVSAVPVIEWFMDDAVYDDLLLNHRFDDFFGPAVMTFDGEVFDNVGMRVRGDKTRSEAKVSWNVEFPSGHLFDMGGMLDIPVDEFNLQRDQWPTAGQGWTVVEGAGQPTIDYIFVRQQRNGEFHGVGAVMDHSDGRWRDANGYGDDSYYKVEDSKLKPYASEEAARLSLDFEKKEGDENDFTDIYLLTQGIDQPVGPAELAFLYDNMDVPALVNYLAVVTLIRHWDSFNQNYRITRDPSTGRWELLHWDFDKIFPSESGHPEYPMAASLDNRLLQTFFDYPELEELYNRRLKTLRDELLPPELHQYYADIVNSMTAEYALEDALWGHSGTTSGKIEANAERIQLIRDQIDADPSVPMAQPANPSIIINEIQYDPLGGSDAEFLELRNLESTPIDLSGWALDDAINTTFRGGTVIPANGYLVFAKDSPTFVSTYGSGIYVGGDYNGKLSGDGEQVRLLDDHGAEVDAVTYTPGEPWPDSGDGPSLERIDPNGPSNDPGNWGRSSGGGSPGAANTASLPLVTPGAFAAFEGDVGSAVYELPLTLSHPVNVPVTVNFTTVDVASNPAVALSGSDYVATSGTVTFDPGETSASVSIEILGDTTVEPPLLWGEWGLAAFSGPTNADLFTGFFGLGIFVIVDDDTPP